MQREFREDLNLRKNEELAIVLEHANKAIQAIADAEKYDLILQEAVYRNPKIDITDKVIKQLATDKVEGKADSKDRAQLADTRAGAVIMAEADADSTGLPRIISDNPYAYFARVSALLNPLPEVRPGVHPSAVIGAGAKIDDSASIAATAVIGAGATIGAHSVIGEGCSIGANGVIGCRARLYPRVVVYHDCVIGDDLIAHSGAVIGADGFGIAMDQGRWIKIPQIGRVVIGNDVEIGANTTIDRGALDDTVIEDGVKLDNQIQVAQDRKSTRLNSSHGYISYAV